MGKKLSLIAIIIVLAISSTIVMFLTQREAEKSVLLIGEKKEVTNIGDEN